MTSSHPPTLPGPLAQPEFLRPLGELSVPRDLLGVLTDIDDTLSTEGHVPAHVVAAMQRLRDAGLRIIPITGRPSGWSEPFARAWPVDAIVAENGAVALLREGNSLAAPSATTAHADPAPPPGLHRIFQQDGPTRAAHFARMQAVLADIEARVRGARRASDSAGRLCDIAIDHSEHTHLPPDATAECVRLLHAAGMNATVSSIHINGWFGQHDKLQGARWILNLLGADLDATLGRWIYIGDSTNDQRMFEHLPLSVGVANIARFVPQLRHLPRHVTRAERGDGFVELAQHILAHLARQTD